MRAAIAVATSVLALASGCAAEAPSSPQGSGGPEAPADTGAEGSPSAPSGAPSGEAQSLTGVVGEEADPDAYTITLTDEAGSEVTTLSPGAYEVQITDLSTIHNFRLTGPGVDQSTSVGDTGETTWSVTLETGTYTFLCEPHPAQMTASFTVR